MEDDWLEWWMDYRGKETSPPVILDEVPIGEWVHFEIGEQEALRRWFNEGGK
jgi:hypothetical protein